MTKNTRPPKAVIYCRVASATVDSANTALAPQEARCRDYAQQQGYDVVAVFHDIAPGTIAPRPEMDAMLAFLSEHRSDSLTVVVDSMSTLARDVRAYSTIRNAIDESGATLKSPSFDVGTDAERTLIETINAAVAQFEGERTVQQDRKRSDPFAQALRAMRRGLE